VERLFCECFNIVLEIGNRRQEAKIKYLLFHFKRVRNLPKERKPYENDEKNKKDIKDYLI